MFEGERVSLRPIEARDLPALRRWHADPEVMRFWGDSAPMVAPDAFEADLRGRLATFETAGYFLIENERGEPIGRAEFERLDPDHRSAEVMILIGEVAAQGQGYGEDATRTLLRYLFETRNVHRVALQVLADNDRAIRLYERMGFVREGVLRDDLFFDGRFHDQIAMSILQPEFRRGSGTAGAASDTAPVDAGA